VQNSGDLICHIYRCRDIEIIRTPLSSEMQKFTDEA